MGAPGSQVGVKDCIYISYEYHESPHSSTYLCRERERESERARERRERERGRERPSDLKLVVLLGDKCSIAGWKQKQRQVSPIGWSDDSTIRIECPEVAEM